MGIVRFQMNEFFPAEFFDDAIRGIWKEVWNLVFAGGFILGFYSFCNSLFCTIWQKSDYLVWKAAALDLDLNKEICFVFFGSRKKIVTVSFDFPVKPVDCVP